jgi:hypothetical protein
MKSKVLLHKRRDEEVRVIIAVLHATHQFHLAAIVGRFDGLRLQLPILRAAFHSLAVQDHHTTKCALLWQGGHNYAAGTIIDCL